MGSRTSVHQLVRLYPTDLIDLLQRQPYFLHHIFVYELLKLETYHHTHVSLSQCHTPTMLLQHCFIKLFLKDGRILRHWQYEDNISYFRVNSYGWASKQVLLLQIVSISLRVRSSGINIRYQLYHCAISLAEDPFSYLWNLLPDNLPHQNTCVCYLWYADLYAAKAHVDIWKPQD